MLTRFELKNEQEWYGDRTHCSILGLNAQAQNSDFVAVLACRVYDYERSIYHITLALAHVCTFESSYNSTPSY